MTIDDATIIRWLPELMVAVVLVCLTLSLRAARHQLLVDNLPTSKTSGVFIGLVELKGKAESEAPLTSHLAEAACVYYRYTVRERWSRTTTANYTDSDCNTQTRTQEENGWKTVDEGRVDEAPFTLQDDRGEIRILPKGARIEPQTVFSRSCGPSDAVYYEKGPPEAITDSDNVREFKEEAIRLHAPLFVVGQARQRADIVAAEIAAYEGAPLFLISTHPEQKVSRGYRLQFWLIGLLGFVLVALCLVWREQLLHPDHYPSARAFGRVGFLYGVAWLLGWTGMSYNSLVELRQRVRQGWANIDVQLKRRADLIPNLVKLVTGLRDHERTVQAQLAALRAQIGATAPGKPGVDPARVSNQLLAVVEAYPDLKANDSFMKLQQQLVETEDRIALARGYFNDIATFYNTRLQVIPDGLIASLGMMRPQALMEAGGFERPLPRRP